MKPGDSYGQMQTSQPQGGREALERSPYTRARVGPIKAVTRHIVSRVTRLWVWGGSRACLWSSTEAAEIGKPAGDERDGVACCRDTRHFRAPVRGRTS